MCRTAAGVLSCEGALTLVCERDDCPEDARAVGPALHADLVQLREVRVEHRVVARADARERLCHDALHRRAPGPGARAAALQELLHEVRDAHEARRGPLALEQARLHARTQLCRRGS